MYTFAFIICSLLVICGGLALIGEKIVNCLMEKKGVSFDDEY